MARAACALVLLSGLAPQAGAQVQVQPVPQVQQKWFWDSFNSLKTQVEQSVKQGTEDVTKKVQSTKDELSKQVQQKKDQLTKGIESYTQAVTGYTDALHNNSFIKAVSGTSLCKHLPSAEKQSAGDIESETATTMSEVGQDPGEDEEACAAVADEVTAENLKKQLKEGETGETVNKFMELVTKRSSAALCSGKDGIKDWLKDNEHLKSMDPAAYKEKLKAQLKGKMGPMMNKFTAPLCGGSGDDRQRLFAAGAGPLAAAGSKGPTAVGALVVVGVALLGLGALAVRRAARQPRAQELERLAPEDIAEGGLAE